MNDFNSWWQEQIEHLSDEGFSWEEIEALKEAAEASYDVGSNATN